MAMHAAKNYGARVVGVTLSRSQVELARERVRDAGLEGNVEIRRQDYRDLGGESFDAISSIGMFEHVGSKRMDEYFGVLSSLLAPTGRLLNHAISTPGGSRMHGRTFINRYVFPDGELVDLANVVGAMERAGFEVRDVESLREHYSETLHAWVTNLESSWDEAVTLVGEPRARSSAPLYGRVGERLRRRRYLGAPGPRGRRRPGRYQRDAPGPRWVGLTGVCAGHGQAAEPLV